MQPPIFVVGSGRSGTTLLYDILTQHPDLGWISNLSNRVPALPWLVALSRLPGAGRHRAFRPASEAIEGYRHCGIDRTSITPERMASVDVEHVARRTREYFRRHAAAAGKERLVSKNTAHSMRIGLLDAIFPEALFVHIHRHPYSVIASLLKVGFWPDLELWWCDSTPRELERAGRHPIEIAGTHWSHQVRSILAARESLPDERFFQLGYETLVTDTDASVRRIADFCALELDERFRRRIEALRVSASSLDKWKSAGNAAEYAEANAAVAPLAATLGYELIGDGTRADAG